MFNTRHNHKEYIRTQWNRHVITDKTFYLCHHHTIYAFITVFSIETVLFIYNSLIDLTPVHIGRWTVYNKVFVCAVTAIGMTPVTFSVAEQYCEIFESRMCPSEKFNCFAQFTAHQEVATKCARLSETSTLYADVVADTTKINAPEMTEPHNTTTKLCDLERLTIENQSLRQQIQRANRFVDAVILPTYFLGFTVLAIFLLYYHLMINGSLRRSY